MLKEDDSLDILIEIEEKLHAIIESKELTDTQKYVEIVSLIIKDHNKTRELLKQGFVGLAVQNQKLQESNDELKSELIKVSRILEEKSNEEKLAEERRFRWKNRNKLPKRDPITQEIFEFIISEAELLPGTYRNARLRLALSLLQITGIRVSELLGVKVKDVDNLFSEFWIAIDRKKGGPKKHKAFLNRKGKNILKQRLADYEFLCFAKTRESFLFTAEMKDEPLSRIVFMNSINKFLKNCSQKLPDNPNLKSHSFRIGYITELWRKTSDIEFVRQSIAHTKLDTTSQYVKNLTDEERRNRITGLDEE